MHGDGLGNARHHHLDVWGKEGRNKLLEGVRISNPSTPAWLLPGMDDKETRRPWSWRNEDAERDAQRRP